MRENRFLKKHLPSAKKKKIAFPPSFWCVCARGKRNPAGDASEIEKGNGDVRQRGDYNIRAWYHMYSKQYLHEYSYVLESPAASFQVQHTWYLVHGTYRHYHSLQDQR